MKAHRYYTTQKVVGTRRTDVFVAATGEYVCQLLNREVTGWIARAERARAKEAELAPILLANRVRVAFEYLEKRARREAGRGKQLQLI